jgi:hypothetical protein
MSKHSNLDLALTELIELIGSTLHNYPENLERELLEGVGQEYDVPRDVLLQAYNKWLEEEAR